MKELISVGKILNFHGILGVAKVGYSNPDIVKNLKYVLMKPLSDNENKSFTVQNVKFHKNFALIKFKEINSIDELLPYKGANIFIGKEEAESSLGDDEFLIEDLIGMMAFDNNDELIGIIKDVRSSSGNDILCIEPSEGVYFTPSKSVPDGQNQEKTPLILVPFAKELVPIVDINKKKVVIKPIEGLLQEG